MEPILAIFLILAGLFAIAGAVCDWEWFMTARKARLFVGMFGRFGARVFYFVLGATLTVVGILGLLGFM
jgi:hypothetical protein